MNKKELTMGELRYISESTDVWQMALDDEIDRRGGVSREKLDHINELRDGYIQEFAEFYKAAIINKQTYDANLIKYSFDEQWANKHPEFFDVEKLLG